MVTIPHSALQEAIRIAYVAGQNGLAIPRLTWIPPQGGTEQGKWCVEYI